MKRDFIVNSTINEDTHTYSCIINILKTYKREFSKVQENLLFLHFSELYVITKLIGHITEEVYDRLGFMVDTSYENKKVDKPDNIRQEGCYKVKVLR